jgi:hypothetical protein
MPPASAARRVAEPDEVGEIPYADGSGEVGFYVGSDPLRTPRRQSSGNVPLRIDSSLRIVLQQGKGTGDVRVCRCTVTSERAA